MTTSSALAGFTRQKQSTTIDVPGQLGLTLVISKPRHYEALQRRGPNRLLWVTSAKLQKPHGHVECLADGLYRGFHGRLAPYSAAFESDSDLWISLLRSTETAVGQLVHA